MKDFKIRLQGRSSTGELSRNRFHDFWTIREGRRRVYKWSFWIVLIAVVVSAFIYEKRNSALQSWVLSRYAKKMFYKVEPGRSNTIVFPTHGPFDVRAGYTLIPEFEKRLTNAGYQVKEQARFSPELRRAAKWGILPYSEPTTTRLIIAGMDGQPLFQAPVGEYYFDSFEEIPPLVVKGLLLIEDRELDDPADSRTNPVVDWDRLAKAALLYTGHKLGLPVSVEGGSTLATQMEKYRHSYDGRTDSMLAKLRQMTDASLKAYQNGPDTRDERRQIILDYMNSIPLAAAPGYGEIHGIGNGMKAWFNLGLQDAQNALSLPDDRPEKAVAYKQMLALLCSVRAPSLYLTQNHAALEKRVNFYVQFLANIQALSQDYANRVIATPLTFNTQKPKSSLPSYAERKATTEIRTKLKSLLGMSSLYDLDRLHLNVESTIDPNLQRSVVQLFQKLRDPEFVDSAGLRGEHLLAKGDPSKVIYGMILYEKSANQNMLRVVTDNLNAPFDINTGMKMQLGSTAKLRTLVNYMTIIASLYEEFSGIDASELNEKVAGARDPLTKWSAETLLQNQEISLDDFLQLALDRKYSANPGETFFTGGGLHTFHNFENKDNGRIVAVREATAHSINLAYVRIMRDLVRYYEARLPYNTAEVMSDMNNPARKKLLLEIADEESKYFLYQAYKLFKNKSQDDIVAELLGKKEHSERRLAILFYTWHHGADDAALEEWLKKYLEKVEPGQTAKLAKAYGNSRLNLSDYAYLLGIHPLELWCAGELIQDSSTKWEDLWEGSNEARQSSSSWLFRTRNRSAQDLRLRIRFEQDAFSRMTPLWKRFGFPFDKLVPSYATAIGSSGDRPEALAQLMGMLLNDGIKKPAMRMSQLRFAAGTPYETAFIPAETPINQVMPKEVAGAIRPVIAEVVKTGTAIRLAGAFKIGDKELTVGGKTGSGDNRLEAIGRGGNRISSTPVDRTAVFVFYIGDKYFGVITVFVPGKEAGDYGFTSSLPVAILKLLAPDILKTMIPPQETKPEKNLQLASQPQ